MHTIQTVDLISEYQRSAFNVLDDSISFHKGIVCTYIYSSFHSSECRIEGCYLSEGESATSVTEKMLF